MMLEVGVDATAAHPHYKLRAKTPECSVCPHPEYLQPSTANQADVQFGVFHFAWVVLSPSGLLLWLQVAWPPADENPNHVVPTLAAMALYTHAVPTTVLAAGVEHAGARSWLELLKYLMCSSSTVVLVVDPKCTYVPPGRHGIVLGGLFSNLKGILYILIMCITVKTCCRTSLSLMARRDVWLFAVVVSEHGHVLAELELPSPPTQPLLLADFNGDGLNDIVLVTSNGLYGYVQVNGCGASYCENLTLLCNKVALQCCMKQRDFFLT